MTKTKIEWCDAVWNPVTGCSKVSQGCKNCYAERMAKRFWSERKFTEVRCHPERLAEPLKWKRPRRVFVNSMSDLFHERVPFEFIDQVFATMGRSQHHTYMILTKRPNRMLEITGIKGEQYPCKPDVFEATYDPVVEKSDGEDLEGLRKKVEERNAMIEKYEQDLDELHDRIAELEARAKKYEECLHDIIEQSEKRSAWWCKHKAEETLN